MDFEYNIGNNNNIELNQNITQLPEYKPIEINDLNIKEYNFPQKFSIKLQNKRAKSVLISGSFDSWKTKYPLIYDLSHDIWIITLNLKKGKYYYKYIIDGNWQINHDEKIETDDDGIINNYVLI